MVDQQKDYSNSFVYECRLTLCLPATNAQLSSLLLKCQLISYAWVIEGNQFTIGVSGGKAARIVLSPFHTYTIVNTTEHDFSVVFRRMKGV